MFYSLQQTVTINSVSDFACLANLMTNLYVSVSTFSASQSRHVTLTRKRSAYNSLTYFYLNKLMQALKTFILVSRFSVCNYEVNHS